MKLITKLISFDDLGCANPNDVSLGHITDTFYKLHKDEIVQAMSKVVNSDLNKFEGGIDGWFGFGSAMTYELGFDFEIVLTDQQGILISIIR